MKKCLPLMSLLLALSCVMMTLAHQRTGGYKEAANDDPEVVAAAEFAVAEQGRTQEAAITLVSVEQAETQVVAGINYRLCLKIAVDDETKDVKVVVYRNLQKAYSLTSWAEESCGSGQTASH
ncbi:MAG: hypothetical protein HY231_18985 [Acidobacteria bacterium]|nr:hypothetical protein [Acidobacteriota bacterium]